MNLKKIKLILLLAFLLIIIIIPLLVGVEVYIPGFGWSSLNHFHIRILTNIAKYSIIVVGLNLLMGYAGQISLGHAAFFGMSAYVSGMLSKYIIMVYQPETAWLVPWISILISLIITAVVAFIIGFPSLVLLKGHYLAMASLGFGIIVHVFFKNVYKLTDQVELEAFRGIPKLTLPELTLPYFGNISINFVQTIPKYYLYWFLMIIIFFVSTNIVNSRIGRALRAIHSSEITAKALGVNVSYFKIEIFVVSAIFAGIIGSIYAHTDSSIDSSIMSFGESIKLVTMVVIGGMASVWGALLGTTVLVILPELFDFLQEYEIIVYGLFLILIMIFLPDGFYVGIRKKMILITQKRKTKVKRDKVSHESK